MKNLILSFLLTSIIFNTPAQQAKLAPYLLKQDMALFESLLKIHPQLNEYITKSSLDSLVAETKKDTERSLTPLEFYKKLSFITSKIQDANTRLYAGKNIYTDNSFFPILLKPISDSLYADIEDQNVPVGSKLISINNIPADSIIELMKKYIASDGANETRKLKKIESFFSLYYYYEFGSATTYNAVFKTTDGTTLEASLKGCSFEALTTLNQIRHSYSYKDHQKTALPYLSYTDNEKVIQLTVNTFGTDPTAFQKELARLFSIVHNEGYEHLIVDIRENEGGFRDNAIELFSYLTKHEFSQIKTRSIKTTDYPQKQYLINIFSDEDFDAIYANGLVSKIDSKKHLMKPKHTSFEGHIFILTSGLNTGNTSLFAMNAKNEPNIDLVGEETGGNYYFHMGGRTVYYQLPHSKIKVVIPTERIVHDIEFGNNPEGMGVTPDYPIELTVDDLVSGADTQLNHIFTSLIPNKEKLPLVSKPSLPHNNVQVSRD